MKIGKAILLVCSFTVLASSFIKIPFLSASPFKIIALILAFAMSKLSTYLWEGKIDKYKTEIMIEGIQVYKLPYEFFKSHNVLIFKGKKYNIAVEEEVMNSLEADELKTVLYHEVGHTHTVSKEMILAISLIALYFNSQGLYETIYNGTGIIYLVSGISLFLISEFLKKYVEYKADEYVMQCGYDKETLISSIKKIEEMNGKNRIIISEHPSTDKRYRNLSKK